MRDVYKTHYAVMSAVARHYRGTKSASSTMIAMRVEGHELLLNGDGSIGGLHVE